MKRPIILLLLSSFLQVYFSQDTKFIYLRDMIESEKNCSKIQESDINLIPYNDHGVWSWSDTIT